MNTEEVMEKVRGYEFSKNQDFLIDPFDELCNYLGVRGNIRRLVLKDLLIENYVPSHKFFRYFISRTQGMPFLQILKRSGFLIELGMNFYINPSWLEEEHTYRSYKGEIPFFEKKKDER